MKTKKGEIHKLINYLSKYNFLRGLLIFLLILLFVPPIYGQYYFGKNKIQAVDYKWYIKQTEHFEVYYYEGEEELARLVIGKAERYFQELTQSLRVRPKGRVPVIIYSSPNLFQETTVTPYILPEGVGGFTEYIKGRVVLPFQGNVEELEHILKHELTHIFVFAALEKYFASYSEYIFFFPPLWFNEGLCEYLSHRERPLTELILRTSVIEDDMVLPSDLWKISGSYKMYKIGEAFLGYLADRYTERRLTELLHNIPILKRFDAAFYSTFGEPLDKIEQEWYYHLRKKYLPSVSEKDEPNNVGRRLLNKPWIFSPVTIKQDTTYTLIFKGFWMGYTGIYQLKQNKTKLLLKSRTESDFVSLHPSNNRIGAHPDGFITFSAKSKGKDKLYIYNLNRQKVVLKKGFDNFYNISNPSFSSDRTRIVFTGSTLSGFEEIYIYNIEKDSLSQITDSKWEKREPSFWKDDRYIIFASHKYPGSLLCLNLADDTITSLFSVSGKVKDFSALDDGTIVFVLENEQERNAFKYQRGKIFRLTNLTTGLFCPTPADGDSIIATVYTKDSYYLMKLATHQELVAQPEEVAVSEKSLAIPIAFKVQKTRRLKWLRKLSLDIAQGAVATEKATESSGGLELYLTDMLGENRLYLSLYLNSTEFSNLLKELNFHANYSSLWGKFYWSAGVYHLFQRDYSGILENYEEELTGISAGISYPFSRFRRVEATTYLRYASYKELWGEKSFSGPLVSLNLSYVKDNSIWSSTGPIDGTRQNFTIGATVHPVESTLYSSLVSVDLRRYLRLSERMCWANRLVLRGSWGIKPNLFFVGGSWSIRGYPFFYFRGSKILLANSELRFPVLDNLVLNFPFATLHLAGLKGAVFMDAAQSWVGDEDWEEKLKNLKGSMGMGLRLNLAYYTVLRFDLAWRTDFREIESKPRWDFFFGWDF